MVGQITVALCLSLCVHVCVWMGGILLVVKGKNGKAMGMVQPLLEGMELNDQSGVKWKLLKLLSQSDSEVIYEGKTL